MKNAQKSLVLPVLLATVVLLVFGTIVYVNKSKKTEEPVAVGITTQESNNIQQETTNTKINTQNSTKDKKNSATSDKVLVKQNQVPGYPETVYKSLSSTQLAARMEEYNKRNGVAASMSTKESLGEFGLVYRVAVPANLILHDYLSPIDCRGTIYCKADTKYFTIASTTVDMEKLTAFILKNSDFFGIDDIQKLKFKQSDYANQTTISAEQYIAGYPSSAVSSITLRGGTYVYGPTSERELNMYVGPEGDYVYIRGHFYPNAKLSLTPRISEDTVVAMFVGKEYTAFQVVCDPPGNGEKCPPPPPPKILTIKKEDIKLKLLPIFYHKDQNTIELRLLYQVSLPGGDGKYIDAIDGEELNPYK